MPELGQETTQAAESEKANDEEGLQAECGQQQPLTEAVLIEEYGFPPSARLLGSDEQFQPGDYLVDPEKRQILLVANGCTYQVFKKSRLAAKLRQRAARRPDTERYRLAVRINPAEAPVAHQLALLPVGSHVEVPAGKIGITTATGVKHHGQETAFTDIMPETIANLHPAVKAQGSRQPGVRTERHNPGRKRGGR